MQDFNSLTCYCNFWSGQEGWGAATPPEAEESKLSREPPAPQPSIGAMPPLPLEGGREDGQRRDQTAGQVIA